MGPGEGGAWSEATEARDGLAFGLGRSRGQGQGKHARSVFVGWRSSEPHQKNDFEFFGAGMGGSLVGGDRVGSWGGGGGRGVEGSGGGSRGVRAEGIGVRAWEERYVEENFLGPGGRGPWSGATEARDGLDFELGRSRG